jgi:hypothetical protein
MHMVRYVSRRGAKLNQRPKGICQSARQSAEMGFGNIHGNIRQISGWRTKGRRTISAPESLTGRCP